MWWILGSVIEIGAAHWRCRRCCCCRMECRAHVSYAKYRIRQLAYIYYDKMWELNTAHVATARSRKSVSHWITAKKLNKKKKKIFASNYESAVCRSICTAQLTDVCSRFPPFNSQIDVHSMVIIMGRRMSLHDQTQFQLWQSDGETSHKLINH